MHQDQFWDVRSKEAEEERRLREGIKSLELSLGVIKRAQSMRTASGYREFVESVASLRDNSQRNLVADDRLTDAGMREARGRVRALNDILGLLESEQASQQLEEKLAAMQNELDAAMKRRPKPREE